MKPPRVVFPYADMAAAINSNFDLLGGPEEALRYMARGYKEAEWTRRTQLARAQAEETRKEGSMITPR